MTSFQLGEGGSWINACGVVFSFLAVASHGYIVYWTLLWFEWYSMNSVFWLDRFGCCQQGCVLLNIKTACKCQAFVQVPCLRVESCVGVGPTSRCPVKSACRKLCTNTNRKDGR